MSKTLTLNVVHVEIDRGKDVVTADVPEHEVPVLYATHPTPGAVRVSKKLPEDVVPTVELDASAYAEYDRLTRKYRTKQANPAAMAYRGAHELTKFGFEMEASEATAAPSSSSRNRAVEAAQEPKGKKKGE